MYDYLELGSIRNVDFEDYTEFYNVPIYMILKVEYLYAIFNENKLYFPNIYKSWEDPYELFMLKHNIFIDRKPFKEHYINIAKQMYGQSWSLLRDSDALWRIYSHDKKSVRIKSTFGKMIKVMEQTKGIMWCAPGFGKVKYKNITDIYEWLNSLIKQGTGIYDMSFMESLFIKREEFAHEKEVRFVLWKSQETECYKGISLNVNPNELIEEIACDPRLDDCQYKELMNEINTILHDSIPILKSDLYSFKKLSVNIESTPIQINSAYKKKEQFDAIWK